MGCTFGFSGGFMGNWDMQGQAGGRGRRGAAETGTAGWDGGRVNVTARFGKVEVLRELAAVSRAVGARRVRLRSSKAKEADLGRPSWISLSGSAAPRRALSQARTGREGRAKAASAVRLLWQAACSLGARGRAWAAVWTSMGRGQRAMNRRRERTPHFSRRAGVRTSSWMAREKENQRARVRECGRASRRLAATPRRL